MDSVKNKLSVSRYEPIEPRSISASNDPNYQQPEDANHMTPQQKDIYIALQEKQIEDQRRKEAAENNRSSDNSLLIYAGLLVGLVVLMQK